MQIFPVANIWWIRPGTSSFLNLAGKLLQRCGMCKSPSTRTSILCFRCASLRLNQNIYYMYSMGFINKNELMKRPVKEISELTITAVSHARVCVWMAQLIRNSDNPVETARHVAKKVAYLHKRWRHIIRRDCTGCGAKNSIRRNENKSLAFLIWPV